MYDASVCMCYFDQLATVHCREMVRVNRMTSVSVCVLGLGSLTLTLTLTCNCTWRVRVTVF